MGAENECSSKPDLASIIMRSKEPELYRNGCTQRIRALEQNLLIKTDNQPNFNCELIEPENGKPERTCSVDTTKKGKSISGSEDCAESEEFDQKNRQVVKFFRRFSSGKQRKDYHIIPTHCGGTKISGEEIVGCGKSPFQVVSEEPEKILCAPISPVITKCSKRPKTRKVQSKTSLINEIIGLPKSDKQRITRLKFKEQSRLDLENQTSGNLSCEFGGKLGGDVGEPLLLTAKAVNISGDQNNESHKPHMENLILTSPEKEVADNIDISTYDLKIEKNDVPYIYSTMKEENACESSGAPQQVGSDKFLKYTFRRKRKRVSSDSNNQDIFPEMMDPTKSRTEDKKSILESQKPGVMVESTRDSRRMAQVARQLISLSEKRWW
ncbi:hypothetical protein J5N97_026672 [Dioscorea zingiberensis]|uniref:Uncharacterized protein n=1 Tax=Dioscorea zingiberensis TaxID=325984 RepID=A0A9D5C3R7_9LILI|nr:hypothetical protein J5N97_026672 [Dioscorea zingiberensis]